MSTSAHETALTARLLSIGGQTVNLEGSLVPACDVDDLSDGDDVPFLDDAGLLLRRGVRFTGPITLRAGHAALCHHNAAALFVQHCDDEDRSARLDLVTGYALHRGTWYRHSWARLRHSGTLVETTHPFEAYYGVTLCGAEDQDTPDGSAWHFFALHGLGDAEAAGLAATVTSRHCTRPTARTPVRHT